MFYYLNKFKVLHSFDPHTTSKIPPDWNLFFKLLKRNVHVKNDCVYTHSDGKTYIPLNWENLFYLGSQVQKDCWNKCRLHHVNKLVALIKESCGPKEVLCSYEFVGTTKGITPASDIDINIYYHKAETADVVRQIIRDYETHVLGGNHLNESFEVNFYGTYFNMSWCDKLCSKPKVMYDQHLWAFMRFVQVVLQNPHYLSLIPFDDYPVLQVLFETTKEKLLSLKLDSEWGLLKKFLMSKQEEKLKAYSEANFLANDAYRSVGAYLHIVSKRQDLPGHMYVDSILDNFGFLVDNLLKKAVCSHISLTLKLLRVAKYMERICEAWLLQHNHSSSLQAKTKTVQNIRRVCQQINILRKSNKIVSMRQVSPLCSILGLQHKQVFTIPKLFEKVTRFTFGLVEYDLVVDHFH